jgi:hypothetical protein
MHLFPLVVSALAGEHAIRSVVATVSFPGRSTETGLSASEECRHGQDCLDIQ